MTTVTIGSTPYEVYQDVAEIDVYANGALGDAADAWRSADTDTKGRG